MSTTAALDSAPARRLGELLVRTCFAERVEAARRAGFATYEPWPPIDGRSRDSGDLGEDLWRLTHLGEVEPGRFEQRLWEDLCAVGLAEESEDSDPTNPAAALARPGRFELTAHRSLIAARDRPRAGARGGVHIGEDSLRFAEAILGVAPSGRALDVGCGSGISSCALGRTCEQVHAIDVVEVCVEATTLSMGLNGMGEKVHASLAQLDAYEPPAAFDCVVGNLPGVPVPPGLDYPPDGAGGPDGLALMRLFLDRCHSSLASPRGVVCMRFQSLGDARGPLLLSELRELAPRVGWDVSVMTESRIPASVRAALTAHHALPVNPQIEPLQMLARADGHLAELGYEEYYASTLVARPGEGSVTYTNLSSPSFAGRTLRLAPGVNRAEAAASAVSAYYGRAHDLPDSFWELGSQAFIDEPVARLEEVLECLAAPTTVAELLGSVFADRIALDPIRARFLHVTVELLVACLLEQETVRLQSA
ncbi:MAG: 50S ribosomal protein L11 methyltransferase [Solirubrobacterales bacterium]